VTSGQAVLFPFCPSLEEGEAWEEGCSNRVDDEARLDDRQSGGHSCCNKAPNKAENDPEVEVSLQVQHKLLAP